MTCEACASRMFSLHPHPVRILADKQVYQYQPSRRVIKLKSERGSDPLLRLLLLLFSFVIVWRSLHSICSISSSSSSSSFCLFRQDRTGSECISSMLLRGLSDANCELPGDVSFVTINTQSTCQLKLHDGMNGMLESIRHQG